MRLYTPFLCAKFQGNRIRSSRFIAVFVSVRKEEENKKKTAKKLRQSLKSHISGTPEAISFKCGMWSTDVGGSVHSKNRLVSSRQHRVTEVRKLRFLSSCQYTAIGSNAYVQEFVRDKVVGWSAEITRLAKFAQVQPHAAYSALTHGLSSHWLYLCRTTPNISEVLQPLEDKIRLVLIIIIIIVILLLKDMDTNWEVGIKLN